MTNRDGRQRIAMAWASRAQGPARARNGVECARALLHAAARVAMVFGLTPKDCADAITEVFRAPIASRERCVGRVGLRLLVLAEAEGYSADELEASEIKQATRAE